VQEYNISVRTFPNNLTAMVMGWQTKANFTVEDEKAISTPPAIKFDAPAATPAAAPPATSGSPGGAPTSAPATAPASPTSAGYQ
jgi:LemA protein